MHIFFCQNAKIQYLGLNLITSTHTEQILNSALLNGLLISENYF